MDMTDDLKSAIAYVREQLGEEELDVIRALRNKAALPREPIPADYSDKVYDLLEEWARNTTCPKDGGPTKQIWKTFWKSFNLKSYERGKEF